MEIHCLGTAGYHPTEARHTACYYLPELDLLLDAGSGLFRLIPLLAARPRPRLDIILSHAHLDHVVGLSFLLNVTATSGLSQIRLYGQSDKLEAVREHLYHPLLFPVAAHFEFCPFPKSGEAMRIGASRVEHFPLDHPGGSVGLLVESAGKRLAYMTDTRPQTSPQLAGRLGQLDLLLHECYSRDEGAEMAARTGHSWLSAVTEWVEQLRPSKTLLIHVNPLVTRACDELELNSHHRGLGMQLAEDGMVCQF